MPARAVLVVVIVRDAGLRSALAAQLAMRGVSLLTAGSPGAAPRPRPGEPAILVADEADVEGERSGWIDALWLEHPWQRVAILTADAAAAAPQHDRLIQVSKNSAVDDILQVIDKLKEIEEPSITLGSNP